MKFTKTFNKLFVGIAMACGLSFTSCEQGLTYDDVPESSYSEVGLGGTPFVLRAREWFQDQIYAVNWKEWQPNYISTVQISYEATVTEENNADAPGGKLYVVNVKANEHVSHSTPNKGHLFVGSKFSGDYEFDTPVTNTIDGKSETTSTTVTLPVKKNQLIGEIYMTAQYDCVVERVDGAPELGVLADFTQPVRYLVKNICYRPAGVPQATRLYEIRVTFKDQE